jgi:hypothetical protein
MASTSLDPAPGVTRPVVFFDVNIGETPAGRIKIGESSARVEGGVVERSDMRAWVGKNRGYGRCSVTEA